MRVALRPHFVCIASHARVIRRKHVQTKSSKLEEVYTGKVLPERFWGDVEIVQIPGKGRGAVTTSTVPAGGLLMVSYPLAIVRQAEGQVPETEQLVEALEKQTYSPASIAILDALHDGTEEPSTKMPNFRAMHAVPDTAALRPLGMSKERVTRVAGLNAFGEQFEDMVVLLSRGDTATAHLGLWPEFSMLNHACAPSAVSYVVGERMMVRATRELAPGEEVTINYLGRDNLRPVAERHAETEEAYGFTCSCTRCIAESQVHLGVAEMVEDLYLHYQRGLGPALNIAVETGRQAEIDTIREKLLLLTRELDAMFEAIELPPVDTAYLKASAFEVYNAAAALAGEAEPLYDGEPMQRALTVLEGVAPGSDLQLLMSAKALQLLQLRSPNAVQPVEQARRRCVEALRLRYGDVPPQVMESLMQSSLKALDKILL